MNHKNLFAIVFLLPILFLSCTKSGVSGSSNTPDPNLTANQQKAAQLQVFLTSNMQFKLDSFYADKAIDYAQDGNLNTNLWGYVKDYIKGDHFLFMQQSNLLIAQGTTKMFNTVDTVSTSYTVTADAHAVWVKFIDYNYNPYTYQLATLGNDNFTLSAAMDGANVFSRYSISK